MRDWFNVLYQYNASQLSYEDKINMIYEFLADIVVMLFLMIANHAVFAVFLVAVSSIHICVIEDDLQECGNPLDFRMSSDV